MIIFLKFSQNPKTAMEVKIKIIYKRWDKIGIYS